MCFRNSVKAALLWLVLTISAACAGANTPQTLNSLDVGQNQLEIAAYYQREARVMRQRAEEYAVRASLYEQLFGPQSDWVTGARLLSHFYEDSAREKERLADVHLQLSPSRQQLFP